MLKSQIELHVALPKHGSLGSKFLENTEISESLEKNR